MCGSGLPVPMKEQVPSLPATLQAWQSGQLLPAVLQQTLSTQLPVAHWSSVVHPAPNPPPFMHRWVVVSQKLPVAQSLLAAQVVLQPAVVHPKAPQLMAAWGGHVLVPPLQKAAGVKDEPVHLAAAHMAVELAHAPAPSQLLVLPQVVVPPPHRASVAPPANGAQAPAELPTLHD